MVSIYVPKADPHAAERILHDVGRFGIACSNRGTFPVEDDAVHEELVFTTHEFTDDVEVYLRLKYDVAGVWKKRDIGWDIDSEVKNIMDILHSTD